ncbi:FUSC family protein [Bhargavaea ullalensis]|uniref:Membrane protein YccC n=1 Tax=Bhargavaea ullalensis TaxID=1265685 RepID=A0ABV2G8V2_9BACL
MKLTKKTILSNTVLFVFILGFVLGFGALFGSENILIGVSTITAMLMLLERDFTSHPVMNTMKFVGLNLFMGIAAFLTGFNIWTAIPLNFIVMFVISYFLIYNLKNPLYFPFSLQYLFLLAMPVDAAQLPLRLASLAVGAVAIMAVQMLANRKRIKKSGDKKVEALLEELNEKIRLIREGEPSDEMDRQITGHIGELRSIIYEKREDDYYLTEEGRLKLKISAALEKLNSLLNRMEDKEAQRALLPDVSRLLLVAQDAMQNKGEPGALEETFHQLLQTSNKGKHGRDLFVLRMLHHLDFLKTNLTDLKKLDGKRATFSDKLENIPKTFQKVSIRETPSHTNSIKLSYAIRMAVGISLSAFIVDFFGWEEGRWMMFTVLSVIIPLYEGSKKKMRDRIFATAVGALAVTVLFTIVQSNPVRSLLLMAAGYLMSYIKVYRYSTILVTFSAIGTVALATGATEILTLERIGLVAAGVVLASLINRFILPYKLADANQDLKAMFEDTLCEMRTEVARKADGGGSPDAIRNLLIITTLIEDRLQLNNQESSDAQQTAWLANKRSAAGTLYELYHWIGEHGLTPPAADAVKNCLQPSSGRPCETDDLHAMIGAAPRIEDRLVLSMVLDAMEDLHETRSAISG